MATDDEHTPLRVPSLDVLAPHHPEPGVHPVLFLEPNKCFSGPTDVVVCVLVEEPSIHAAIHDNERTKDAAPAELDRQCNRSTGLCVSTDDPSNTTGTTASSHSGILRMVVECHLISCDEHICLTHYWFLSLVALLFHL